MLVSSVTLIQPLSGEVSSHYRASNGFTLRTDDAHMGGGIWISKAGQVVAFVTASNVAGHGPEVVVEELPTVPEPVVVRRGPGRPPTKKLDPTSQDLAGDQ